ncbi:hypothetical protein BDW74DRAFT_188985 [Aspergillus multicolor]|uniref:uncharacterized protein n=1 Tax=Aspergillus multicolor TaxID=41759 RepID=UPI003CCD1A57
MSQPVAFVTGATGHQGGATAREILNAGVKVHALVQDPASKSATELPDLGAHLTAGNFDNPSSLNAALAGTTAVFLNVSPVFPNTETEVVHARNIIDAAIASRTVTCIIYSSVSMTGRHDAYRGDTAMTIVDVGDVGKFAAAAILDPVTFHTHEIELGVEALTPAEIVRALSRVSGREIGLEFYSDDEVQELAARNPVVRSQVWANEVGYWVDFKRLEKYGIHLTRFGEYFERHVEEVRGTFS